MMNFRRGLFTLVVLLGLLLIYKQVNLTAQQQSGYIFTANEGGSITKIGADDRKVIATINVKGAVHNVQVSPNGKILGATVVPEDSSGEMNMGEAEMNGYAFFYDSNSNKLLHKVEVGAHPAHIVFTPKGEYAFVTNNEDNNVTVIDMEKYQKLKTIPTGKGPHGFRISKDGKFAYLANMGEDSVSVINIVRLSHVKNIKVGKTPVTTGITPDGKTLLATLNKENSVAVVDLVEGRITKIPVGEGPAQVFIQQDGKYAFVANQGTKENPSNTITKIEMKTKKIAATITTGKGAHGIVTSKDNKFIYVTNMFDNTVSIINNKTNKVVSTIRVGKIPNGITYK